MSGLAIFSCLLVTKDEFSHKQDCPAAEQWLHAILFGVNLGLGAAGSDGTHVAQTIRGRDFFVAAVSGKFKTFLMVSNCICCDFLPLSDRLLEFFSTKKNHMLIFESAFLKNAR